MPDQSSPNVFRRIYSGNELRIFIRTTGDVVKILHYSQYSFSNHYISQVLRGIDESYLVKRLLRCLDIQIVFS